MKLLIFFLIFFLFIPIISGAECIEYNDINGKHMACDITIGLKDSEGKLVNGAKFNVIEFDGTIWKGGSGVTKDGSIHQFRFTFDENNKERCFLVYFQKCGGYYDGQNLPTRNVIIEGRGIICPSENQNYFFTINEIENKPSAIVLHNMTNASLNLAKQSKETANKSYVLSWWAFWLAVISLICPVIYLLKLLQKLFKKRLKYNDIDYMFFDPQNKITSGQLTFFFWLGASACILIRTLQPEDYTWITDILIGAFITAGFITARIDIEN